MRVPVRVRARATRGRLPSADDPEILRDFLLATERMPREEAAEVAGVSVETLTRWERNGVRYFHRPIRLRLLRFLVRRAL